MFILLFKIVDNEGLKELWLLSLFFLEHFDFHVSVVVERDGFGFALEVARVEELRFLDILDDIGLFNTLSLLLIFREIVF